MKGFIFDLQRFVTLTDDDDYYYKSKSNISIFAKGGNDTIDNGGNNVKISGDAGDDSISNSGDYSTVNGGAGNDTITNSGDYSTVNGGAGDDSISNSGDYSTVNGGAGNDTITNSGKNVSISGGSGDDFISLDSTAKNNLIIYNSGDGNDTIYGFNNTSTLQIGDGTGKYAEQWRDQDIVIAVGSGEIILKNARNLHDKVNIKGVYSSEGLEKKGTKNADTINNSFYNMKISALGGNDSIYNDYYGDNVTIDGGDGNDSITNEGREVSINGGSGNDSITNEGWEVSINGGSGNDSITNEGWEVSINGGSGNDLISNSTLGESVSIDGGSGNDSITNYGNSATISGGTGNDSIYSYYYYDNYNYGDSIKVDGGSGNDYIYSDSSENTISGGTGDDSISLDSDASDNLISYTTGDGNDLITGFNESDTLQIGDGMGTYSTQRGGDDIIVNVGNGTITLEGAATLETLNIDGEEVFDESTLLNVTNDTTSPLTIGSKIGLVNAATRTKAIKITANKLDNTIYSGSGKDTLYGKDGNDYLAGNAGNDKLYGQNGDDTLWGGTGNDTLKGGDGDDIFIYSAGKDVITDYVESEDKISIGAAIDNASLNGSDVVFSVGTGTLKVKDARGQKLTLINSEGNETETIIGGLIVTNGTPSQLAIDSTIETVDASTRTTAVKITGNALDNYISGGLGKDSLYGDEGSDTLNGGTGADKLYGQNGDDLLVGGAGNDSLWGGDGADTFLYINGDGKDVISGFDNDDMLQIIGTFSATYNASEKTIAFKVGKTANAIMLKDFTATTFNINGDTYKISDNKLVK